MAYSSITRTKESVDAITAGEARTAAGMLTTAIAEISGAAQATANAIGERHAFPQYARHAFREAPLVRAPDEILVGVTDAAISE